jgi:hypothetical protein
MRVTVTLGDSSRIHEVSHWIPRFLNIFQLALAWQHVDIPHKASVLSKPLYELFPRAMLNACLVVESVQFFSWDHFLKSLQGYFYINVGWGSVSKGAKLAHQLCVAR